MVFPGDCPIQVDLCGGSPVSGGGRGHFTLLCMAEQGPCGHGCGTFPRGPSKAAHHQSCNNLYLGFTLPSHTHSNQVLYAVPYGRQYDQFVETEAVR